MLILKTKINRPQLQQVRLLKRSRLLNQLSNKLTSRLVLIQAAAGYGKTTVMVQLSEQLEEDNFAVGWLTLDNDDNDPVRLYQYLWSVLTQFPDSHSLTEGRVTKNHIHHLLSQLDTTTTYTLFIDELEAVTNPTSLNLIWWLYLFLPTNYHLVIASRIQPNWPLAKEELQGLVRIVRANELRLSLPDTYELQQYLQSNLTHNIALTPYMAANQSLSELSVSSTNNITLIDDKLVSMLIEKTEGWLTGIQLINLYCKNEADLYQLVHQVSGAQRQIAEFLAEQVFLQCDEYIQDFLLNISVLRKINASLCHDLTEATDAQFLLENLSQQGLFIQAIDDQYQWFRIHELMRQFLQTRLQNQDKKRYWIAHTQAAEWHQEHRMPLEAIYHAQVIGDNDLVLSALKSVSHDLILGGRLYSFLELTKSLSDTQLCQHPALLYDLTWGLVLSRRHHEAGHYIKVLEQEKLYLSDIDAHIAMSYKDKQLGLSAMIVFIADDLPKAYQLAKIGLQQLTSDAYFFRAPLVGMCALYQLCRGNIEEARSLILQSRLLYIKGNNPYGLAYVDSIDATCDRLLGDVPSAIKKFQCIGISPEYAQLGTNDSNQDMMLGVASSLKADFYYELNRIEDTKQALTDFDHGENMAIADMVILGFLTELKLGVLTKKNNKHYYVLNANSKADEWSLPRLIEDVRQWENEQALKQKMPIAFVTDQGKDYNIQPSNLETEKSQPHFLTLTELLTGLDLLPYRTTIFLGNSQQIAEATASLNQLLKDNLPFVLRNARIKLLLAMAYHVLGKQIDSYTVLIEALKLFRLTQSHRIILDEHPLLYSILTDLFSYQGNEIVILPDIKEYIESLLKISGYKSEEKGDLLPDTDKESIGLLTQKNDEKKNNKLILSEREVEILLLVEQGLSDGQIADKVFLSIHTVKWHLRNIYHKLQVRSRTQAVAEARQQQILD